MVKVTRKEYYAVWRQNKNRINYNLFSLKTIDLLLNVINYSNYATILGNNDVVFSKAIVKMKCLRKTSHVADQQTLFFLNYLYVSSDKHTNLKERHQAPLILSKEPKLSMLTVCYMYVELITTVEVTVFCTMQTPHDCAEI